MDWFNTQFYRDFGYGLLYPQVFPHHKRPTDEQQHGTIAWGKDKAKTWFEVLDRNILGTERLRREQSDLDRGLLRRVPRHRGRVHRLHVRRLPERPALARPMKKLASWPNVNEVMYGFAGSMRDKKFQTV